MAAKFEILSVYRVDINQDAIFKVDYKGEQRQMIRNQLPSPRGLAILHGDIFWVDRNLGHIAKASKLPSQVCLIVYTMFHRET